MGLSKLSEKCQKCKRKDTCDDKRMEACGYIEPMPKFATGGIVNANGLFIERESSIELIGKIGCNGHFHLPDNDKILKSISNAITDYAFEILPLRKTNETN